MECGETFAPLCTLSHTIHRWLRVRVTTAYGKVMKLTEYKAKIHSTVKYHAA
jgi:hypothetical protein